MRVPGLVVDLGSKLCAGTGRASAQGENRDESDDERCDRSGLHLVTS
jgi:hypothetical protein